MKIGIVGNGVVGRHLQELLAKGKHSIAVYDKYDPLYQNDVHKEELNRADLVFIAVPTPPLEDGGCNLAAVEEVVNWVIPPICIKSTIPPGTVDRLVARTSKSIVFSPEYIGETPFHQSGITRLPELVVLGGDRRTCELVINAHRAVLGPDPHYFVTDAVTAELSKYMENCFFATKVAFVAQFYLLAAHFGADFTQMREIWTADSRVGRSHSTVVDKLGFDGKCLPKDLSAIIVQAHNTGGKADLLAAVRQFNEEIGGMTVSEETVAREAMKFSPVES